MQIKFIEIANSNPDFKINDFKELVDQAAPKFQLNAKQIDFFTDLAKQYAKKHEAVSAKRKEYSDDKNGNADLFKDLFDNFPVGNIKIIEGPITLYFQCFHPHDYATIYYNKPVYELTNEDIERVKVSGGVKKNRAKYYELRNSIIAENAEGHSPAYSEKVIKHEEQHALNDLVKDELFEKSFKYNIESSATPDEAKQSYIAYIRSKQQLIDFCLKDEILAYYQEENELIDDKSDNPRYKKIGETLGKPYEDKGLYDYYRNPDYKEYINIKPKDKTILIDKGLIEEEIDYIRDDIFSRRAYRNKIINYLYAIKNLEQKGYTQNEIIYLLTIEHPENWERTANMMPKK